MKWLYAAYRMGSFDAPKDMSTAEFRTFALDKIAKILDAGGETYVLEAATGRGRMPVGVMTARMSEMPFRSMQPHVEWFTWTTPRNKVESIVNFINQMRTMWSVIIFGELKNRSFFDHICRYGILRRVGKLEPGLPDDGEAMLYQSRKG